MPNVLGNWCDLRGLGWDIPRGLGAPVVVGVWTRESSELVFSSLHRQAAIRASSDLTYMCAPCDDSLGGKKKFTWGPNSSSPLKLSRE
jgi:hypothetical protein